jgi:hypothetical protein
MSLAYERRLDTPAGHAAPPQPSEAQPGLNIDVVFTSVQATLAALKRAGALASRLNSRITLVVPQVVPFPCPLSSPPVLLDFSERRFRVLAGASPVDTTVQLYLCRDKWDALTLMLKPRSLVVVGGRRRWWPTEEERLARKLGRAGHEVVFVETE